MVLFSDDDEGQKASTARKRKQFQQQQAAATAAATPKAPADALDVPEASFPESVISSPTARDPSLIKTQEEASADNAGGGVLVGGMRDAVSNVVDAAKSARAFVARTVGGTLSSAATAVVGAGSAVMGAVGVGDSGGRDGSAAGGDKDSSGDAMLRVNVTIKKHFFGGCVLWVHKGRVEAGRGWEKLGKGWTSRLGVWGKQHGAGKIIPWTKGQYLGPG